MTTTITPEVLRAVRDFLVENNYVNNYNDGSITVNIITLASDDLEKKMLRESRVWENAKIIFDALYAKDGYKRSSFKYEYHNQYVYDFTELDEKEQEPFKEAARKLLNATK